MPVTHGTCSAYTNGCRCDQCRRANATYQDSWRRKQRAIPAWAHGRESTYTNYACRCNLCKAANSEARQARYQRKKLFTRDYEFCGLPPLAADEDGAIGMANLGEEISKSGCAGHEEVTRCR